MSKGGVSGQLKDWKTFIQDFLRRRPELVISNTRGYFRLLQEMEMIDESAADKLCQFDARGKLIRPETYVRVRRELIESGVIYIEPAQKRLLDDAEGDIRGYYRSH